MQLPKKPSLKDIQEYVLTTGKDLGFYDLSGTERCLMLGEEVGELFKSIRKVEGIKVDSNSKELDIGDELADVLKQTCAIANFYGIDLEEAFKKKEEKNTGRWQ